MSTLVLDNGAYTAKIGYTHGKPSVIPNCQFRSKTARLKTFTANQIDEIKDPSGLFYILPFQKGYLVNWDVQRKVWDYLFGREMYQVDFVDSNIIITEPYFNFTSIQESMNEILFEEYQFQAVLRVNSGALSAHRYFRDNPSELCCIIVDSGYSFTHIVPYCRSKKQQTGIVRINVGGKLLTNHLKEIISYRQLHVMDETHVINQVKEDVCYVSQDFYSDMEITRFKGEENTVMRDYVLPDFSTIKKGFCKPLEEMVYSGKYKTGEQILRLTNERFSVPEILFHPSDIGIPEMGIPEAIVYSIQNLPGGQTVQLNCEQVPGALKQIDAGNGQVFGVNAGDNIYTLYSSSWTQIPGALKHVTVGAAGVWGVNGNNIIYKLVGGSWVQTDGLLKQIDAGGAQFLSGANMNDDIFCLGDKATVSTNDGSTLPWSHIEGKLKYYSCGPLGCWGVNSNDDIYYRSSVTPSSCSGSSWQQVEGKLSMIEVGSDGSVFGVNSVGNAYRRNGISASNPIGTSWSQLHYKTYTFRHLSQDLGLLWVLTKDQMILRCKL